MAPRPESGREDRGSETGILGGGPTGKLAIVRLTGMVVCNEGDGTSKTTTEQPRDNMCGAQHMDSFREILFAMHLAQGRARSSFYRTSGQQHHILKKNIIFTFSMKMVPQFILGVLGCMVWPPWARKKIENRAEVPPTASLDLSPPLRAPVEMSPALLNVSAGRGPLRGGEPH